MNLIDFLPQEAVLPFLTARTKKEVLEELAMPFPAFNPVFTSTDIVRILCEREALGSTAVGEGVAIPHGKVEGLGSLALVVGRSLEGIPFDAPDGLPCRLFFLILTPSGGAGQHLRLLAQIARRAKDPVFRSEMLLAENRAQLWQVVIAP